MNNDSPGPPESQPLPDRGEAIFHGALQLPAAQRADYVAWACGDDKQLRESVENLLKANDDAGGFLEEPAVASPDKTLVLTIPLTEKPGDRIGRYKLLQPIGEGGCGVVYMAEQQEPVRRRVALKVIKLGMDTKQVVARFEAERQALALMDHPNIAKVLDAGATETGRSFFVMELVRGIKITEYCDQNKLSPEERLKLFAQVCHAIQHAHQKGIIHRDIKPSNILVTVNDGAPVPKVIDFGIAKATEQRLTDKTVFTAFDQFIGTPAYMSPEQAVMTSLDIDTRTDIYSLGVLLYELLTGQTPFDAKKLMASGFDKMRQTIREQEPERPSTRLRTMLNADLNETASHYRTEAPKLIHLLRGDVDWIVMKALEKDRTRRYETANGLAMDIQRYLSNEPVTARPPSTLYRFQKLARRNRTVFAAAGVSMAALVIGLVLSLYLFVREKSAFKRAVAAEEVEKQLRQQAEEGAVWSQQITRAGLLLMRGEYNESERMLRDIPPHATMVPFYNVFGGVHARHGEWQEALTNWNLVVKFAPEDPVGYHHLAPLLLQLDDAAGYKDCRAQILRQFGNTSDPRIAERMVKDSLILPATTGEMAAIAKMADVISRTETDADILGFNLFAKGLVEYRQGHYASAAEHFQKVVTLDTGAYCRIEANLLLAMTQFQLNQLKQSHDSFAEVVNAVNRKLPKAGHLDEQWNDWIIIQALMREAATLIPAAAALETPAWQTSLTKAGLKFTCDQQEDGTWGLVLDEQPVTDLAVLRDAPLSRLSLMRTPVSDLGPLRGMSLKKLWLVGTKVTALDPLRDMRLNFLQISGTAVADIRPLRGMRLRDLKMSGCTNLVDLSPLAGMTTLQNVILPPNAKKFEFLRDQPDLTHISFKYDPITKGAAQTAAEFWAEFDQAKKAQTSPNPAQSASP